MCGCTGTQAAGKRSPGLSLVLAPLPGTGSASWHTIPNTAYRTHSNRKQMDRRMYRKEEDRPRRTIPNKQLACRRCLGCYRGGQCARNRKRPSGPSSSSTLGRLFFPGRGGSRSSSPSDGCLLPFLHPSKETKHRLVASLPVQSVTLPPRAGPPNTLQHDGQHESSSSRGRRYSRIMVRIMRFLIVYLFTSVQLFLKGEALVCRG